MWVSGGEGPGLAGSEIDPRGRCWDAAGTVWGGSEGGWRRDDVGVEEDDGAVLGWVDAEEG